MRNPEREDKQFRDAVDAIVKEWANGDEQEYARRWRQLSGWARNQSNPARKKRLKKRLLKRSGGNCEGCDRKLEPAALQMHRKDESYAFDKSHRFGYFEENIELLCISCHQEREAEKDEVDPV